MDSASVQRPSSTLVSAKAGIAWSSQARKSTSVNGTKRTARGALGVGAFTASCRSLLRVGDLPGAAVAGAHHLGRLLVVRGLGRVDDVERVAGDVLRVELGGDLGLQLLARLAGGEGGRGGQREGGGDQCGGGLHARAPGSLSRTAVTVACTACIRYASAKHFTGELRSRADPRRSPSARSRGARS